MIAELPTAGVLALAATVVFVSGVLRGLTGFGFAIAAAPLLSLLVPPRLAIGVVVLLQLGVGLIDGPRAWRDAYRAPLPWLVAGAVVGTPLGMAALRTMPDAALRLVIAAAAALALISVARGRRAAGLGRIHPGGIGLGSGLLNGLAAMPGPPVVAYVLGAPIPDAAGRALLIVFFALTALAAAVSGLALGVVDRSTALLTAPALPFLLVGTWLGGRLFRTGPPALYRQAALALLAVAAALAAWNGLASIWPAPGG